MIENKIKTTLVKKISKFTDICTNGNNKIEKEESYYFEVGIKDHLHSIISRRFCFKRYSKFDEKKLLGDY
jgi:hypothetical protein